MSMSSLVGPSGVRLTVLWAVLGFITVVLAMAACGNGDATPTFDEMPPPSVTWSRVPHDEAVFGGEGRQEVISVTAGGPGLVVVGASGAGVAVWTSPDGISWSRVPHDEAIFGEAIFDGESVPVMSSVTAGGPGLVAVGLETDTSLSEQDGVVWTSADGITWSRAPHDAAVFGAEGRQGMGSVTAWGRGLVAVGGDGPNLEGDAAVWVMAREE